MAMSIDEAIQHCKEMALCAKNGECGEEHRQLAEWLRELKRLRAEPVRHGRWIDGDPYCPICRKDKFRGLDADVWADWQPDYCPNCGAKMDG